MFISVLRSASIPLVAIVGLSLVSLSWLFHQDADADTSTALSAPNICLEAENSQVNLENWRVQIIASSSTVRQAAADVSAALDRAGANEEGKALREVPAPVVRVGCNGGFLPLPSYLPRSPEELPYRDKLSVTGAPVQHPSHDHLHIFVLGEEAAAFDSGLDYVKVPYEVQCDGHVCAEVTTALYVSDLLLLSPEILSRALIDGLGLLVPAEAPADEKQAK